MTLPTVPTALGVLLRRSIGNLSKLVKFIVGNIDKVQKEEKALL